jgi:hypothetical protein
VRWCVFRVLMPFGSFSCLNRVAFIQIIPLLGKAVLREYQRIVNNTALLYSFDFVSTNSDFYTNKERRESYGCLVANMTAQQHIFEVCWCGFIACCMLLFLFSHTNLTQYRMAGNYL